MCSGSEGAARFDHDHPDAVGRQLPGRADPERADPNAVVKLAPALLPVLGDLTHRDIGEVRAHAALARCVGVGGQLDRAVELALLDALREQLEHDRPALLGPREGDDGLRRASAEVRLQATEQARVVLVHLAVLARGERLEKLTLLGREAAGDAHVHEHPVVTAAGAGEHRHALPTQDADLARLRPGLELQLLLAVEGGHASRSPRAPPA